MYRLTALLLTLLLPAVVAAAEPTPTQIDELMHKSGLWTQIEAIQPAFTQGIGDAGARLDKRDNKLVGALQSAFAAACAPEKLRASVSRQLRTSLSVADVDAALVWLNSDLGKRITALEEANSTTDAYQERLAAGPARVKALTQERRALYDKLAKAVHAGDVGAAILINVNVAIVRGLSIAIPNYTGQSAEDVRAEMEARRPQFVAVMEQQQIAFFATAYASLSDEEVERYIAFAQSAAGGRFQAATVTALDKALTDAATEAGATLVRKNQV